MTDGEKFIEAMNKIMLEARTPSLSSRLKALENDSKPLLKSLRVAVNGADELDLSRLKPEYAAEAKTKHITKAREALFNCLKRYMSLTTSTRGDVIGRFWHYTEWSPPKEALNRMAVETSHREIRQMLRDIPKEEEEPGTNLSKRAAFVMKVVQGDNQQKALAFLHAMVSSPEDLISHDLLSGLRLNYTRKNSPELYADMTTAKGDYSSVRKACGIINAQCIEALGDIVDCLSEAERQEVFPPQDWYEKHLAQKRLQREQVEIDRKERDKQLEANRPKGLNLSLTAAHQSA